MKKLIILLFTIFALTANAQLSGTLRITQTADAEFTTDLFQLVFYGNVNLSNNNPKDSTRWIGDGYDIKFTFFNNGLYDKAHLMKYCYKEALCIATLKSPLFNDDIVVNGYITDVVITEMGIEITARATSKLSTIKHK